MKTMSISMTMNKQIYNLLSILLTSQSQRTMYCSLLYQSMIISRHDTRLLCNLSHPTACCVDVVRFPSIRICISNLWLLYRLVSRIKYPGLYGYINIHLKCPEWYKKCNALDGLFLEKWIIHLNNNTLNGFFSRPIYKPLIPWMGNIEGGISINI